MREIAITDQIIWMYKQGFTFENMLSLDIPYRTLLQGLFYAYDKTKDEFYKQEYHRNCSRESFEEEKYMIIADEHRGSLSENPDYAQRAFSYAKKQGIKTIFHGGDIGDGMIDPSMKYNSFEKQIDHIIEDYPKIEGMRHKIVLGNHDKKYRNYGMNLATILPEKRDDIDVWGYQAAYFKIHSHLLSLEHGYCLEYRPNWYIEPELRLIAHSHELRFNKKAIKIPSLCVNDISSYSGIGKSYQPGFLILNVENFSNYDIFLLEGYQFQKKSLVKTAESSYYMKKLTK